MWSSLKIVSRGNKKLIGTKFQTEDKLLKGLLKTKTTSKDKWLSESRQI